MNGKILQSELINRVNYENQIKSFEYNIEVNDDRNINDLYTFKFTRLGDKQWCLTLVIDYLVYNIPYEVPKVNMDLTMVAAFGLKHFQYELANELEKKSILNFSIGDEIRDM